MGNSSSQPTSLVPWLTVAAVLVGLGACSEAPGDDSSLRDVRDPSRLHIPDSARRSTAAEEWPGDGEEGSNQLAAALRDWTPTTSIGVLDGSREQMFGEIADIELEDDRLLVLDEQYSELRVYDISTGAHIQTVGGGGAGPGEFRSPVGIAVDSDGLVYVADRTEEIKRFRWQADSLVYDDLLETGFFARDLCILRDTLYIHSISPTAMEHALKVVSKSGEHVRSIGRFYDADSYMISRSMNGGELACSTESRRLFFLPNRIGMVWALRPDGTIAWVSEIGGYKPHQLEGSTRRFRTTIPEGGGHSGRRLTAGRMGVVVQLALITRERRGLDYLRLDTYVVSPHTGEGGRVDTGGESEGGPFPEVYDIQEGRIAAAPVRPYPQVMVGRIPP